jgi:hypothetical protein
MRAIFVGGEQHGRSRKIGSARSEIVFTQTAAEPSLSYWIDDETITTPDQLQLLVYALETVLIHATQTGQEKFAIYRNGDDATTWKEFNRLYLLSLGAGVIGINRWLDEQMECRLAYDAELRRKLWSASVAFEFTIREIESRNAESRLKRRFPETFTK